MGLRFGLIGDGQVARKHKVAIQNNGGEIYKIHDPILGDESDPLGHSFFDGLYCVVICSPSHLHHEHIKLALSYNKKIIVEKPAFLPWEPVVDDDRINIVLQLRWLDLPKTAEKVKVTMVRDEAYFKTWKGDPRNTGGLFYNLFIHYIDLANILGAEFEGLVTQVGEQVRMVDDLNIMQLDMHDLYIKMYDDIINCDKGIKPKDIFYLHWLLNRNSNIYGFGADALNKRINIKNELGI